MKRLFALVLCALVCLPGVLLCRAADEPQTKADELLRYYQQSAGVTDTQTLVDDVWSDSAGRGAESLVLAAKQYKSELNLSRYAASLKKYLAANTVGSATTREMLALMFVLSGVPDPYITQTLNEAPGKLGVMSWVFALHLLNNGYTSTVTTQKKAQKQLLDMQLSDGGWAVSGSVSDVDVTAMTVTSLAPAYQQDSAVTAAVERAVSLLSKRQNDDGTLSSYGVKNAESVAQTVIALSALGLDATRDSRFIKNGHTLFDALVSFRLADGSYCHEADGASNRLATAQVFSAFVAAYRQAHGLGSLYYVPPAQRPTITQPATTKSGGGAMPIQTTQPTTAAPKTEPTTVVPKAESTTLPTPSGTTAPTPIASAATTVPAQQNQTQAPGKTTAAAASTAAKPTLETNEASTAFPEERTAESTETQAPIETVSSVGNEPTTGEPSQPQAQKVNIKLVLLLAVWALAAVACIVLFLLGKRNKSWFIAVLLAAALLTAGLLVTSIQRKEEFFSVPETSADAETITASIAIRCDSILPYAGENAAVPTDGVVLNRSEITLAPGGTAYDQLLFAARQNGFTFINKSAADNDYKDAYISTLAGLSEFDYGENSGWLFAVNGQLASVGCGAYQLKDGDSVVWYYTCNYVEDMTRDFSSFS